LHLSCQCQKIRNIGTLLLTKHPDHIARSVEGVVDDKLVDTGRLIPDGDYSVFREG
jgi:hypothetical protein